MPRILILGANAQLARHTLSFLLVHQAVQLTLYGRRARRLVDPIARLALTPGLVARRSLWVGAA